MPHRHPKRPPIPTLWLMTDERMGDDLWAALEALPRGAGIVFRHHATPPDRRRALFARVAAVARRRRLMLVRAGREWLGAEGGVHGPARPGAGGIRTWAAHSRAEAVAGKRAGATILFVSPVYPTRSHPDARAIGPLQAAAIGRGLGLPTIALGGVDAKRFTRLRGLGFHGWAAIDAWLPDQKRKAVPI
ncbi:MAG: thiamine monophosphate synthase [Sphingomonas bacterium]|uniref:thiamine phosphate synthase n=1 Tax=Sphingomonas bacterium TaxID=1895847 RepID=UPI0026031AA9|nr:thiamine phosphate synthase [Sphingomonas bacterium]MDB5707638.1 thiamine monophosphate synthase [Sphingomonas bacterium]